jgi:hypothetical protein
MKGLLLQPKLAEIQDSLVGEANHSMEFEADPIGGITPRPHQEVLRDLQHLNERQDCQGLVREALVYLGLHSGNTDRINSSMSEPSITYLDSTEGSSIPSSYDRFETPIEPMALTSSYDWRFSTFYQQENLDDANQFNGEGTYSFYGTELFDC